MASAAHEDRYWDSPDGLKLHYRHYDGDAAALPVICMPGLTRNARDFEELAEHLAGKRRVLCVDFRGRGDSEYARDPMTYNPMVYAGDVAALLDQAGIERFVAIGTSLGGLVTSLLATMHGGKIAGYVINDIGPDIDPEGIERIKTYVGVGGSYPTWMHAARSLQEGHGETFPDWSLEDWLAFAKKCMTVGGNGRIVFDYDMKIAEPFRQSDGAPDVDLWPAFEALGGRPGLLVRGEQSDLLTPATRDAMLARIDGLESVTVPRVGHAPTLAEPEAIAAIDALLEKAG